MRGRGLIAPGSKDRKNQIPVIEDLGQLQRTISSIGYALPDASTERNELGELQDKVESLLIKNQELVDNKYHTMHTQTGKSIRKLVSSTGLRSISEKIEDAVDVLDSIERSLPKLITSCHEGEAIPVEVDHQQHFVRLAQLAANGRKDLSSCTAAILWLLKTKETTKLWKDCLDEQRRTAISLESAWNQHSKLCQLVDSFKSKPECHRGDESMNPDYSPGYDVNKDSLKHDSWMDIDKD